MSRAAFSISSMYLLPAAAKARAERLSLHIVRRTSFNIFREFFLGVPPEYALNT